MDGRSIRLLSAVILLNCLANRCFAASEKLLDDKELHPQLTPTTSPIKIAPTSAFSFAADKKGAVVVGAATPYIIGGKPASREEYPWYVLILIRNVVTNSTSMCGGSLYTDRHVITAAHCIKGNDVMAMHIGLLDRREQNAVYKAESVVIHEEYLPILHLNDLAIITTDKPVTMGKAVRTISLPGRNETFFDEKGYTIGLGRTKEDAATLPANLLEVIVPIWDNRVCKLHYQQFGIRIHDNMLCAGGREKDSCQGDSGGPLNCFSNERNRWELCGVVSWGVGCGREGFPGVYTRVTEHLDWIDNVVKNYVKWSTDGTSADACEFHGDDLLSLSLPSEQCGPACTQNIDCTHYSWRPDPLNGTGTGNDTENGTGNGTCLLQTGPVSKYKALSTTPADNSTSCGVAPIKWRAGAYATANGCDFPGNSFAKDNSSSSASCAPLCAKTKRCSHYTWSIEEEEGGGTCWLKIGPVTRRDAVKTADASMECGILEEAEEEEGA